MRGGVEHMSFRMPCVATLPDETNIFDEKQVRMRGVAKHEVTVLQPLAAEGDKFVPL